MVLPRGGAVPVGPGPVLRARPGRAPAAARRAAPRLARRQASAATLQPLPHLCLPRNQREASAAQGNTYFNLS